MTKYVKIHFDAACDNNSKFKGMGLGVAVFVDSRYRPDLSAHSFYGTHGTNNIAEWASFEWASSLALKIQDDPEFADHELYFSFYGDSLLVVNQYRGLWEIVNPNFQTFYESIIKLLSKLENLPRVEWVPRTSNKEADLLSKQGLQLMIEE